MSYKPEIKPVFAIPNGGYRHLVEAVNLKKAGVTSGVPDTFIAMPSKDLHGLFIEFKDWLKRPTPSDTQKAMMGLLMQNGYECKVAYRAIEAINYLEDYLGRERSK